MREETAAAGAPVTQMAPGKALVLLGIVVVGVAVYIGLAILLGMDSFYGGFLFILYWMGIKHTDMAEFWPSFVGGMAGLGIAWSLHNFPILFGTAGMIVALAIVLLTIYAMLMGWVPLVVNTATMLFLTVGTIPALQNDIEFSNLLTSYLYGAALIGVTMVLAAKLKKPGASVATAATPEVG